jgi:hypothetical protein
MQYSVLSLLSSAHSLQVSILFAVLMEILSTWIMHQLLRDVFLALPGVLTFPLGSRNFVAGWLQPLTDLLQSPRPPYLPTPLGSAHTQGPKTPVVQRSNSESLGMAMAKAAGEWCQLSRCC